MAKVTSARIEAALTVTLQLNEQEVRALDGIFGYDVDQFLKAFYEKCGRHYVQPHEAGVRSLHATVRGQMSGPIAEFDKARKGMYAALQKVPS